MSERKTSTFMEIRKREFDGKYVLWAYLPDPFYKHLQTNRPKTWISVGVYHTWKDAVSHLRTFEQRHVA